ncbi:alpha/beta fold hydrolase [Hymenobacter volaticus]|uniref:alpha/beta fold hydrolase n=1 Tax=Hymenobacter volaticus TaxID=2932254 RepID=UPI0035CA1717
MLTPALPGYGTTTPASDYSLEAAAEALRAELAAAGVSQAVLVGHSMGATWLWPLPSATRASWRASGCFTPRPCPTMKKIRSAGRAIAPFWRNTAWPRMPRSFYNPSFRPSTRNRWPMK